MKTLVVSIRFQNDWSEAKKNYYIEHGLLELSKKFVAEIVPGKDYRIRLTTTEYKGGIFENVRNYRLDIE